MCQLPSSTEWKEAGPLSVIRFVQPRHVRSSHPPHSTLDGAATGQEPRPWP